MAKEKIDKDKLIEGLRAENDRLRRKNKVEAYLSGLPRQKKLVALTYIVTLLMFLALLFVAVAVKATRPEIMTEEEWRFVLSETDGRTWTVTKKSADDLKALTRGTSDGKAYTERYGESIKLKLTGDVEETYSFSLRNGEGRGMLGSYAAYLEYSESTLKTGRAITLIVGDRKATFIEDK